MLYFTVGNVYSAITSECGRVPSCKSVYFGISKLILFFHIAFIYHVLCFILYSSCFAFFVIDCTRKQVQLIKLFKFIDVKDLPSVSQSNVQAVTA